MQPMLTSLLHHHLSSILPVDYHHPSPPQEAEAAVNSLQDHKPDHEKFTKTSSLVAQLMNLNRHYQTIGKGHLNVPLRQQYMHRIINGLNHGDFIYWDRNRLKKYVS